MVGGGLDKVKTFAIPQEQPGRRIHNPGAEGRKETEKGGEGVEEGGCVNSSALCSTFRDETEEAMRKEKRRRRSVCVCYC